MLNVKELSTNNVSTNSSRIMIYKLLQRTIAHTRFRRNVRVLTTSPRFQTVYMVYKKKKKTPNFLFDQKKFFFVKIGSTGVIVFNVFCNMCSLWWLLGVLCVLSFHFVFCGGMSTKKKKQSKKTKRGRRSNVVGIR